MVKIKEYLFKIVSFCNSKKQKEMIVEETIKIVDEQERAEHILSFEDILKEKVNELLQENEYLATNLNEILYLYSVGELEKLEEKLQDLVSRINQDV